MLLAGSPMCLAFSTRQRISDKIRCAVLVAAEKKQAVERFEIGNTFEFDPATAELRLNTLIPGPDSMPSVKTYKYTMKTDEITTTALSQKASRDRYLTVVQQVALRSLHEVFEADRRGLINTISLELGTETIDPATGNQAARAPCPLPGGFYAYFCRWQSACLK